MEYPIEASVFSMVFRKSGGTIPVAPITTAPDWVGIQIIRRARETRKVTVMAMVCMVRDVEYKTLEKSQMSL